MIARSLDEDAARIKLSRIPAVIHSNAGQHAIPELVEDLTHHRWYTSPCEHPQTSLSVDIVKGVLYIGEEHAQETVRQYLGRGISRQGIVWDGSRRFSHKILPGLDIVTKAGRGNFPPLFRLNGTPNKPKL